MCRDRRLGIVVIPSFDPASLQVTSGLNAGDHLIIEGHRDVENNQPVNVVKALQSPEELTL